ncbi:SusC/RagA family TonB-linked outer membrane protein [Flavobacterium branchiicola]|uniref:SusC/RagA family TonB-linked outer membrane protein n=1 Tax=Flavobacterium branchiicola TaxID=1114875 RepID=A0ABV9PLV1_9FLAO|nr:SusC/RagA family TonB-linked outer membrane protein [Flavobacterium branchiicola]MBS7255814.1 SusC/RagA family TonB-linked outer membrane protein [Flavobacterium branchiicola]
MKKLLFILFGIILFAQPIFAQTKTVTGTIKSETDGLSLPGVSVLIDGTSKSTVTDFDGKFSITADENETLVFSFVGFATKRVKLSAGTSVVNLRMVEELNTLSEVVVLGSTVRATRKELGNAVTSLKAEDLVKAQPVGLTSALQGKIAGAQVSQNSGDPAGGFSIKLRGTSSILGSSDPLYVIDGVILNNATTNVTNLNVTTGNSNMQIGQNRSSDINPNDIQSIEVLNGGAAAAIYGSRAANGVVLITTKKGVAGETRYTFATSVTSNHIRKKIDMNMSDKQFVNSSPALFPIQGNPASPTTVNVLGRNLETRTIGVQRYDYQDDIFTTGVGTDTYFSLQGGDDKTKYFGSLGYLSNEGIIKNTDFKRIGAKLRLKHDFNSKLSATVGLNYVNSSSNEKPDGNVFWSPINSINITNNTYDINQRDINGNLLPVDPNRINPLSIIETFKIQQNTDRIISDLQLNYVPFKNFNADLIFGLDNYNQRGNVYIPRYPYTVNPAYYNDGYVSEATNRVVQFNNDLNLRYLWNINDIWKSTTYGGYNVQTYRDDFGAIEGRNLKPFIETINAFNTLLPGSPSASQSKYNLWGYYLQETIGFRDRLYMTLAIRQDASTIFSSDNRSQFYPKASVSYVLSDEKFMQGIHEVVSSVRLRGSWGKSGSLTAIKPYARFTNYSTGTLLGNSTFTMEGLKQGNLDLRPEQSVTYEVGGDFGFIKDRLNLSFSYYNADIDDLLLPVQLAASEGATNTIKNVGQMNNKGYEINLKYDVIKKEDLHLDVFVNYSSNRNKVTGLPQTRFKLDSNLAGAPVFVEMDKPIGIFYGTYFARNADGSLLLTPTGYPQTEKGDVNTGTPQRDASGQPTGTILNKEIGNPNPDYIIAFGANMNYKKFGLSVLFDGVQGVDVFDADYRTRQGVGSGTLVTKELNGELPRGYIWSVYNVEEFRVVDGSYLKLREVSLNYSFGKLNNFFDDLTITASGRNLISWDNFTSFDPETNSGGQSSVAKYNFGTVPIPSSYTLAVKVQF